ncbi:MAG: PAS domain S-box protein [Chloroflexaceae bacterium]|nr:PAS domain S-box protein [Chloroflexaceae bacterium]
MREQGLPQAYAQVIRTGTPFRTESIYGNERVISSTFDVHAVPLPEQHVVVMFENITARKQAEQDLSQLNTELEQRVADLDSALRNSARLAPDDAERYFEVIEITRDGLWDWDIMTDYVYYSPRWLAALGYTADEVVDDVSTWESLIHPDDKAHTMASLQAHLMGQAASYEAELRLRTKDGAWKWVLDRGKVVRRSPEGQPLRVIGTFTDITERKQQEAELQVFKALADNALDGVAMADLDGTLTYVNPAYRTMFEQHGDPVGQRVADLYPSEVREIIYQEVFPHAVMQGEWLNEIELTRPNGSHWVAQQSVFAVRDEQGQPIKVANLLRDVTTQRQQEAEREALQQQLIEAQRYALRELSTPLIPISERVVIMPLIGAIDSNRAQQVMETLLEGVAQHSAELAILDITGVQVVDTQVAQAFIQAAQAVRLLGAQVMLTGIQPQIAQTLVHLGVDLDGIITRGSLKAGIAAALHKAPERSID